MISAHHDDAWLTNLSLLFWILRTLSLEPEMQIISVGGPHAAWELRQDAIDFGEAVLFTSHGRLPPEFVTEARSLISLLSNLPEEAFQGDSLIGLQCPDWRPIRAAARVLLQLEVECG